MMALSGADAAEKSFWNLSYELTNTGSSIKTFIIIKSIERTPRWSISEGHQPIEMINWWPYVCSSWTS
jgi:hypothetical protein